MTNLRGHLARMRPGQRGMTLIELMVSLLIGSLLVLAVTLVMSSFEGRRRTVVSGADLDQSGNIAMYQIDQLVRSAGSGLAQGDNPSSAGTGAYAYGCPLYASTTANGASGQILPATSSLPQPFDTVNSALSPAGVFRLAPVLILPRQATTMTTASGSSYPSDVLVVMSSGTNLGQVPSVFASAATATQLNLTNTLAFAASDLVLLLDQQGASGGLLAPCMVTQVSSTYSPSGNTVLSPVTALPLGASGSPWYAATIGTASISGFSDTGVAMDLGNPTPGSASNRSPPSFQLIGVGSNNTLFSYDLLNATGTYAQVQARAQDVFELHALYGVHTGTTSGCVVDTWVDPHNTTTYSVAALSAGTPTAAGLIKSICAVRVGLILRTALPEKTPVQAATTLTLFSNFPLGATNSALVYTRPLSTSEQFYRYRTVEATIPVRNNNF